MVSAHNWFECKVQYEKLAQESDKKKKTTDTYLVDALSFTEAESRLIEEVTPYMTGLAGDFNVSNIKRSKIAEIFENPAGDKWYKSKVIFTVADEEKQTEKKVANSMLVQASSIENAIKALNEGMQGTISDYEINNICETPILDIFKYTPEKKLIVNK